MKNHPTTDRGDSSRLPPELVVLTQEEARQITGGLALAVIGVTGGCCHTCGIQARFVAAE